MEKESLSELSMLEEQLPRVFEFTHDISHLTCADFLREPGVHTPMIVCFSTVIHECGSLETLRDPRGFAVKFYTREGKFELVGNNILVFFIRDGIKVCLLGPYTKLHSPYF
jgi:catalase